MEGCIKILDAQSLGLVNTIVTSNLGDSPVTQYLHPLSFILKSNQANQNKSFCSFSLRAFLLTAVFNVTFPLETHSQTLNPKP